MKCRMDDGCGAAFLGREWRWRGRLGWGSRIDSM